MLAFEKMKQSKKLHLALYGLLILSIAFLFKDVFFSIFDSWQKEEYSYAYLVFPLSILLLLHKMARNPVTLTASYKGLPLLLAGLSIHILGLFTGLTIIPQYGLFLSLMGLVLTMVGPSYFLYLLPALAYLFFAIPLPTTLYVTFSAKLQLLSSSLGTQLLQALGYSVFQEGNIIDLGSFKLQVIEACSGLRYIFPLLGFSYLIALFYKAPFWKRAFVFASALPLAVLMNVLRIAATGIAINQWGQKIAEGFLHYFEGWVVFLLCLLLLYLEIKLLCAFSKKKEEIDFDMLSLPHPPFVKSFVYMKKPVLLALGLFFLLASLQSTGFLAPREATLPARNLLTFYPDEIGPWHAQRHYLSAGEIDLLRPSDYLLRSYSKDSETPRIDFFIAYYDTQIGKSNLHSPEMCLPGSGWQSLTEERYLLSLENGNTIPVNRVLIQKGTARQLVYYWFEQAGQKFSNPYLLKSATLWNALTLGRTDSALLRLTTPLRAGENIKDAEARLHRFFNKAAPLLKSFIPET